MSCSVHPRACGELAQEQGSGATSAGSSPRVRGTQVHRVRRGILYRFIPARAGNSPRWGSTMRASTVHPRACRELHQFSRGTHTNIGSSPRVRGTPLGPRYELAPVRFIPARAGNSHSRSTGSWTTTVHPARAGNSPSSLPSWSGASVHPRACGELWCPVEQLLELGGSSPRVRGTRPFAALVHELNRFIPARAGNSLLLSQRPSKIPVHPRACGELDGTTDGPQISTGSSPRVRGTPFKGDHVVNLLRFIPARAGNSSVEPLSTVASAVHPRACGELDIGDTADLVEYGSSPRVRGTRPSRCGHWATRRFIPARAGNSPERPSLARR